MASGTGSGWEIPGKAGSSAAARKPGSGTGWETPGGSPAAAHGGHGGFLHALDAAAHFVAQKSELAAHDIKAAPGGLIDFVNTGAVQPWKDFLTTGHVSAKHNAAIDKLIASTADNTTTAIAHPLRDPFNTLLTVAPAAHALGAGVARGAAAADAVKAGEGVRGAAKAAARTPEIKPRLIGVGETKVALHPSANPAVRAVQAGYDRLLQHGIDTNLEGRVAAHAMKRVNGSLEETGRFQQRMRQALADDLEHAGRALGSKKVAQAALRLTSENSTAEEAAAFHKAQAAKGVAVRQNLAMGKLYDRVARDGLLTHDEHGNVTVDAARHPELAAVDAKLAAGQTKVDAILREHGLMTDEGMAARRDAPAQIRAGATYEKPTPAKAGIPSQALIRQRAYVDRLQALYDRTEQKVMADRKNPNHQAYLLGPGHGGMVSPLLDRLGGGLSVAKDELQRIEDDAARRQKPTGIRGGKSARPGRGYVPYKVAEAKAPRSPIGSSTGPVVGVPRSPLGAKAFTGAGLEKGLVPDNTTGLVARNMRRVFRFVSTDEFRKAALETGSKTRRSSRDVLVRVPGEKVGKIGLEIDQALGRQHVNLDELHGHELALSSFLDRLIPGRADNFAIDRAHQIGADAPAGYRWVDRNVLGDSATFRPRPAGKIAKTADTVNSAVTAATVYFKVGHVGTRVLTNAATAIIQGSAKPLELGKSFRLWKQLDHKDRLRALAAAGQHGFDAMPHEGANAVGRAAGKGAQWWAKHADAPFRFASIAYEARRAGYTTTADFQQLLDKLENTQKLAPVERAKVEFVAKEANRAGIAYDRLNSLERNYISRAVWFLPWIKGSTVFAGRTFLEHPYKAALLGAAGVEGRQAQQHELGDLPSYEQGLFKLAGGAQPLVSDFSTFSPFATPADVIGAAAQPKDIAGFLNPAVGSLQQLISGQNAYGGQSKSPYVDALLALAASTPEQQVATAYANRNKDQSARMFRTTPRSALLRMLVGPGMPRRINLTAAHKAAVREHAGR